MPIDPAFPKNHKVIGKHKNEDGRFTLYGVQEDLMQSLHPTNKFKNHTKPEEKNMSPWEFMVLSLA
jgi:hypothetical protein